MPGPCSRPNEGTVMIGKSKYVRRYKQRGSTPSHGYPPNLKARIDGLPTNPPSGYKFIKPGSYKK